MSSFTKIKNNNKEQYLINIVQKLEDKSSSDIEKTQNYNNIAKYIVEVLDNKYNRGFSMRKRKESLCFINDKLSFKIIELVTRDLEVSENKKLDEKILSVIVNVTNCNINTLNKLNNNIFMNLIFTKIDFHLKNRSFDVLDEFVGFLATINIKLNVELQEKSINKIINIFLEFNQNEHTNHYYFLHKTFIAFINSSNIPVCMNKIYENGNDIISKIKSILEKNELFTSILYKERIDEIYKLMIQAFCNFVALKPNFVKIMREENVMEIVSSQSMKKLMPNHCGFIINCLNKELPE